MAINSPGWISILTWSTAVVIPSTLPSSSRLIYSNVRSFAFTIPIILLVFAEQKSELLKRGENFFSLFLRSKNPSSQARREFFLLVLRSKNPSHQARREFFLLVFASLYFCNMYKKEAMHPKTHSFPIIYNKIILTQEVLPLQHRLFLNQS